MTGRCTILNTVTTTNATCSRATHRPILATSSDTHHRHPHHPHQMPMVLVSNLPRLLSTTAKNLPDSGGVMRGC